MSVARFGINKGLSYSNVIRPYEVNCNFVVDSANGNGLGIRSLKSNGVIRNVFMHTSATPGSNDGATNPNPAVGYALVQFKTNFNYYLGGFSGFAAPVSGSAISISGSSVLTLGNPYVIGTVGSVPAPKFTVGAVADSGGNSASKYFTISDVFGNNYLLYNVVSGVGLPPSLTGALANYVAIPVSYASGSSATTVGAAIATAVGALNSSASFTAVNTAGSVLITSAASNTNLQFLTLPNAQTSGFSVSAVTFTSLASDWQNVGLPMGLTPTVGQSFIATATGSAKGSGTVYAPGVSQIVSVQVVGDPNQSIANASIAANGGAYVLVQFNAATSTSNPTLVPTAPSNNTVVAMNFLFDSSEVTIDGI